MRAAAIKSESEHMMIAGCARVCVCLCCVAARAGRASTRAYARAHAGALESHYHTISTWHTSILNPQSSSTHPPSLYTRQSVLVLSHSLASPSSTGAIVAPRTLPVCRRLDLCGTASGAACQPPRPPGLLLAACCVCHSDALSAVP
jgi:hypothetical protein